MTAALKQAAQALRGLIAGYVSLLHSGREKILDAGGSCDSVERMVEGDPHIRAAREVLAALEAEPQQAQAPESYEHSLRDLECPPDPDLVDRELAKEALQAHVQFPTMLRKMWSGDQVQQWIDENVNKKGKP